MDFADRLSELIAERGLNNLRLAKDIGPNDSLIGAWRRGRKRPTLDNLILLADYFDVSLDYLTGRSELRNDNAKNAPVPDISENGRRMLEYFEQLSDGTQRELIGEAKAYYNMEVFQSAHPARDGKARNEKGSVLNAEQEQAS